MEYRFFVLVSLLVFLISAEASSALTCTIRSTSCSAGEQPIFSTYQRNNTHAGNYSQYPNNIYCCSDPFLTSTSFKKACGIGEFSFLAFYNYTNSHVETFNNSVLELRFEENSGSLAFDSSGNGNHGDIYGATWTDGKFGKALSFDGVDDYVSVPYSANLYVPNEVTLTAWIYPRNPSGSWQTIIAHSPTAGQYNYWLYLEANALKLSVYSDTYPDLIVTNAIPTANTWYYIVVTAIKGSTVKVYVNGVLVGTGTAKTDFWTGGYLTIGDLRPGRGIFFNGTIDEVRIYNRALSEEEIKSSYYEYRACVSAPWLCNLRSSCLAGETCIASVYNYTNSHVAECGYYPNQLCCKREDIPPTYSNVGQNSSSIPWGSPVKIYAYWKDNGNLSYAILSTNETGSWQNKTVYGSPLLMNNLKAWSNFTWQNSSVPAGTVVAWKIYANDSAGNWNVTPENYFTIACRLITVCSSGCDATTIQEGINMAQNCDTVLITDSRWYNENVTLNKSITLTSNSSVAPTINSTGTSLKITANYATVSNLTIAYNGTSSNQHVVWITGNYTTLANNTIRKNSQAINYLVYVQNSANNTIFGNNITSRSWSSHGIYITGSASTNNTIDSNLISYEATSSYGIIIETNNNTIKNNNITSTGGYLPLYLPSYYDTVVISNNFVNSKPIVYNKSLQNLTISATNYGELILANSFNVTINSSSFMEAGILLVRTTNSSIINSNITTKTNAINLVDSSNYNTIFNNNISTSGSDRSYGIVLSSGDYINLTKNNITIFGDYNNFAIEIGSSNNVLHSNKILTLANFPAIVIYSWSYNHKIINTNISNTNSGSQATGITIQGSNINITSCNITTIGSSTATYDSGSCTNIPSAICIRWGNNTRIIDSILNATNYYDVFVSGIASQVNYLINTSFNKTDLFFNTSSNSTLYNQYYLDVKVQNTTLNPLQGANVTAWDKYGTKAFSQLTNSSGFIQTQILTEFLANSTFNASSGYYYFTNYTLNTTMPGYINDTRQINLTSSRFEIVTLTPYIFSLTLSSKLLEGIFFTNKTGGEINVQFNVDILQWNNATWNYNATSKKTEYWINNSGTVPLDICFKANSDLSCSQGTCLGYTISADNIAWNNSTLNDQSNPSYDTSKRLSTSYQKIVYNLQPGNITYLRFWLYVPSGKPSGIYNTTYTARAVDPGASC